jgi:small subunit ribosomal protein S15
MANYLTKERKVEIIKQFGVAENNSGSAEAQIAMITERIAGLSSHLRENSKDQSCRRALLRLVGHRKQLLQYLYKKDITKYRELIETLGIRK